MSNILKFVPDGFELRPIQEKVLIAVEKNWDSHRVFVLPLAVGSGKSLIAVTIARWQASMKKKTAIITPQVALQDQYERAFADLPSLKGKGRYTCCSPAADTCGDFNDTFNTYCDGCPFVAAKKAALGSPYSVFNFQTYMYSNQPRDIVISDEAQNIAEVMSDMYTLKLWKHQHDYGNIDSYGDLMVWMEEEMQRMMQEVDYLDQHRKVGDNNRRRKKVRRTLRRFELVKQGMAKSPTNFLIERKQEPFRGVPQDVLLVRPINLKYIPHSLWRRDTHKIILMSATISTTDVEDLGLQHEAVFYAEPASPISPKQRPFVYIPVAHMTYRHRQAALPKIASAIKELAQKHGNEKGVIHTTYAVANSLKRFFRGDDRYLWHNQANKEEVLQDFLSRTDNSILVASGMSEGIDLQGDLARWQVLTQVVWPSLMDQLNVKKKAENPNWYLYKAVLDIMQRTGRVCRGPEDYGITYALDKTIAGVIAQGRRNKMLPKYFLDAIKIEEKKLDK